MFYSRYGVACLSLLASVISAPAQDWPTRPVTITIPYAAGGQTDVVGRALAERVTAVLGQQVVVENLGGAGGMIAAQKISKAAPDGYQAVIGNSGTHAFSQSLHAQRMYDAENDFAPVTMITQGFYVLVTRNDLPANTLSEFVAYAKANQKRMQFGSAGAGAGTHVVCALFNSAIGVNVTHIPYRGTAPAQQDLIGGRIDYMCDSLSTSRPQIIDKNFKAIALLGKERSQALPDLATSAEQGLANFNAANWNALFFPKGTPRRIADRFSAAVSQALDSPVMKDRLQSIGVNVAPPNMRGPEYLKAFVSAEIKLWAPIMKSLGTGSN